MFKGPWQGGHRGDEAPGPPQVCLPGKVASAMAPASRAGPAAAGRAGSPMRDDGLMHEESGRAHAPPAGGAFTLPAGHDAAGRRCVSRYLLRPAGGRSEGL